MVTLLIVDDYPPGLAALALLLEGQAYQIVTARSGTEALRILAERDVHLILTDERMDGIKGSELAARVRAGGRNRDAPIVLLSGVDGEDAGVRRATALPPKAGRAGISPKVRPAKWGTPSFVQPCSA